MMSETQEHLCDDFSFHSLYGGMKLAWGEKQIIIIKINLTADAKTNSYAAECFACVLLSQK